MKIINRILGLFAFLALMCTACIEKYEDEVITGAPQIAFLEGDTAFEKEAGDNLFLEAVLVDGTNVIHEWKFNNSVVSNSAILDYELDQEGEFDILYTATNELGVTTKKFTVKVVEPILRGVVFSTSQRFFKKSIGENIKISATVKNGEPATHKWEVGGAVVSTSSNLNYAIVSSGNYTIKYTITREGTPASAEFQLEALKSPHGNWFVWQDLEEYVICLKDDPSKVVAHHNGLSNFVIETYTGSKDQKFMKGAYFGYGDANVKLEYYNIYNLGTNFTLTEHGTTVDAEVSEPGKCRAEGWRGWYFIVNATGEVRMIHFLETWDMASAYLVSVKGCIMHPSNDKKALEPVFYDRCKVDGVRDHTDYLALEGKYYDFKIVNVKDLK